MRALSMRSLILGLVMLLGGATVAPGAVPATLAAQTGGAFQSQQFGYLLEWSPPWQANAPMVMARFEANTLVAGNKMASFIAIAAHSEQLSFESSADLLDFVVGGLVAQVQDAAVVAEDPSAVVPWAELTYTSPLGPAKSYVEVFALEAADAYLYSIVESPIGEFEEALTLAADNITLDGAVFLTPGRTGTSLRTGVDSVPTPTNAGVPSQDGAQAVTASYRGGPAHTGEQPGPAPLAQPSQVWTFATGDEYLTTVAVSPEDGLAFTSSNGVYAIDLATGEEVWKYTSQMGFVSPMTLANGVLYAAGEDGSVYAFDPRTGAILWQAQLTVISVNGGPVVAGDTVYVTSWDGSAYALDAASGTVRWQAPIGGIGYGQPAFADGYVVVPGGQLGETAFDGLLAFQADSGSPAWQFAAAEPNYPTPAIANGVVYYGSSDGNLYAIELTSGRELWRVATGGAVIQGPAVSNGVVYVANETSVLGAYDAATGTALWTVPVNGTSLSGITVTRTETGGALILVGDDAGVLHVFSELGAEVYTVQVADASIFVPVAVVDGVIYVSATDGTVYALAV